MKLKQQLIMIFTACTLVSQAQFYGEINYSHPGVTLSSAKRTLLDNAWVMAGYWASGSGGPDFVIDKVDPNGRFGPNTFSTEYQIKATVSGCGHATFPGNCAGVSIVESPSQVYGETYAITGAYSGGVFFATLDGSGNVLNSYLWHFPSASSVPLQKPVIVESTSNPGDYYICGNWNNRGYVMKIDGSATPLWNALYSSSRLAPRDIIESPFSPSRLIVVGEVASPASAIDGFFMILNAGNGNVLSFKRYDLSSYSLANAWFECIAPAFSTYGGTQGFIIGGYADDGYWFYRTDPNGNFIWSTTNTPQFGTRYNGDLSGVYERFDSNTSQYEYYGVGQSDGLPGVSGSVPNTVVYKLDETGFFGSFPNEFHYIAMDAPAYPRSSAQITAIETGGGVDDGLQIFGTNNGHQFAKAYFNGYSGCNDTIINQGVIIQYGGIVVNSQQVTITPFNALCSTGLTLFLNPVITPLSIDCYAQSLPNGSNLRATGIAENNNARGLHIYPNPVNKQLNIEFPSEFNGTASISLLNAIGQCIYTVSPENSLGKDKYSLNMEALDLAPGIYFIKIKSGKTELNQKIIYEK